MHNPMNEYFAWFGCTLAILSVIGPMLQTNYYFTGMISICIYFCIVSNFNQISTFSNDESCVLISYHFELTTC